jgi:hypothetical protein
MAFFVRVFVAERALTLGLVFGAPNAAREIQW